MAPDSIASFNAVEPPKQNKAIQMHFRLRSFMKTADSGVNTRYTCVCVCEFLRHKFGVILFSTSILIAIKDLTLAKHNSQVPSDRRELQYGNMPSSLDYLYRSLLLTKFFSKGWGRPENLQR